jgi:hypothetical protein
MSQGRPFCATVSADIGPVTRRWCRVAAAGAGVMVAKVSGFLVLCTILLLYWSEPLV